MEKNTKIATLYLKTLDGCVKITAESFGCRIVDFCAINSFDPKTSKNSYCRDNHLDCLIKRGNEQMSETCLSVNPDVVSKEELLPLNVKDAANYIVRLFYNNSYACRSAVIQKLLFIAQLKTIHDLGRPLFTDSIMVKPLCFSIEFISLTYPTEMFVENSHSLSVLDKVEIPLTARLDAIENTSVLPSLSSFYSIIEKIDDSYKEILNKVFSYFGCYSGAAIGECMRKLSLHSTRNSGDKVTVQALIDYIKHIPVSDNENAIILFVKNDSVR